MMKEPVCDPYALDGTINLDRHPCYLDPATCPDFQNRYEAFRQWLRQQVASGHPATILKFGYGDYLFLTRQSAGSAEIGFRALSRGYDEIGHDDFVTGAGLCDVYACDLLPDHMAACRSVISRQIDWPAEFIYAAVASRWLFQAFPGQIGLIGADKKLALIKRLMHLPEYRAYLGIDSFCDYIPVPQNFACDDLAGLEARMSAALSASSARLFLVGIGHVKTGLLHRLPRYANAVFLDVGQGIDALAGVIDTAKPYFGGWNNHRLSAPDPYDDLDYLSYLPFELVQSMQAR